MATWATSWRLRRDIVIVTFSLCAAAYEIIEGGGRPSVLAFLSGLLLSPIALRTDEAHRRRNHNRADEEDNHP